jgi:hypothetical protein
LGREYDFLVNNQPHTNPKKNCCRILYYIGICVILIKVKKVHFYLWCISGKLKGFVAIKQSIKYFFLRHKGQSKNTATNDRTNNYNKINDIWDENEIFKSEGY